jgi:enamine deaminase RidA (YjgF/YER057c/UK114 family)
MISILLRRFTGCVLVLLGLASAFAQEHAPSEPASGDIQIFKNPRETVVVFPLVAPVDKKGELVGPGDLAAQLNQALENIRRLAAGVGVSPAHFVTLSVYTNDKGAASGLEKMTREAFLDGNPGITLVETKVLRPAGALVAVEAVAIVRGVIPRR